MIPRTLGEVDTEFYAELATQFRGVWHDERERVLLSAMLTDQARLLEMTPDAAEEIRSRIAVTVIEPAFFRGFRSLRKSATEYVDDSEGGSSGADHDPAKQRYVAMRPVLNEIDNYQRIAVEALLAGFIDDDAIRRWCSLLELATHGELADDFVMRCVREESTSALLTATEPTAGQQRARELFAATHLLPAFNNGIRDLRARAKEEADPDRDPLEVTSI
jgi:hypothetical protein